jgi:hypothetical protein
VIGKHRRPPQTNDLLITEPAAFRPGAFFGQAYRLKQQFEMVARPRFEPIIRQVSEFRRTIGGNIADLRRVGKSGSGLPTRTPDCAVRSDHSFTTALYSDKGKFHSDLNAARNVNMSE